VTGNASFDGGSTMGRLANGLLEIHGDFTQGGDPFSFVAEGTHITRFTGGGGHTVTMANPATTEFGELSFQSIGADLDTLFLTAATTRAVTLQASGNGWIWNSSGAELDVQLLNVNGTRIQGVRIDQNSGTATTLTFNNVIFSGFTAADVQLRIAMVGKPTGPFPRDFSLNNIDFSNVPAPDGVTGFYIVVEDLDGSTSGVLEVDIVNSPDQAGSLGKYQAVGGAQIFWTAS